MDVNSPIFLTTIYNAIINDKSSSGSFETSKKLINNSKYELKPSAVLTFNTLNQLRYIHHELLSIRKSKSANL